MLVKNVNDQFELERIIFSHRKTDIYTILSGGGETVNMIMLTKNNFHNVNPSSDQ